VDNPAPGGDIADRAALTDPGMTPMPEPVDIVLPPVSLASEEELRRAAAAAPLVVRVCALPSHLGPDGRPTTQTGALRVADAKALAPVCGDEVRLERPEHFQRELRWMADLPGVEEAYELTLHARLLDQTASRVRRNPGHPGATDELARVAALADAALELGVDVGDAPDYLEELAEEVGEQLVGMLDRRS
jgi:hypothetical protein